VKKYSIIYADPPWTYPKTGGKKNSRGMAKQFYNTMSIEELKSIKIPTSDNAILFMWITYPKLEDGLALMRAWGFEYYGLAFNWIKRTKTGKDFFGMGYWTRANPEGCYFGIKGKMKPLKHNIAQLVYSDIGKHSQKPSVVREKIVDLCGDLPRIELFAREKTEGWDVWGNEVENDIELDNLK